MQLSMQKGETIFLEEPIHAVRPEEQDWVRRLERAGRLSLDELCEDVGVKPSRELVLAFINHVKPELKKAGLISVVTDEQRKSSATTATGMDAPIKSNINYSKIMSACAALRNNAFRTGRFLRVASQYYEPSIEGEEAVDSAQGINVAIVESKFQVEDLIATLNDYIRSCITLNSARQKSIEQSNKELNGKTIHETLDGAIASATDVFNWCGDEVERLTNIITFLPSGESLVNELLEKKKSIPAESKLQNSSPDKAKQFWNDSFGKGKNADKDKYDWVVALRDVLKEMETAQADVAKILNLIASQKVSKIIKADKTVNDKITELEKLGNKLKDLYTNILPLARLAMKGGYLRAQDGKYSRPGNKFKDLEEKVIREFESARIEISWRVLSPDSSQAHQNLIYHGTLKDSSGKMLWETDGHSPEDVRAALRRKAKQMEEES